MAAAKGRSSLPRVLCHAAAARGIPTTAATYEEGDDAADEDVPGAARVGVAAEPHGRAEQGQREGRPRVAPAVSGTVAARAAVNGSYRTFRTFCGSGSSSAASTFARARATTSRAKRPSRASSVSEAPRAPPAAPTAAARRRRPR